MLALDFPKNNVLVCISLMLQIINIMILNKQSNIIKRIELMQSGSNELYLTSIWFNIDY